MVYGIVAIPMVIELLWAATYLPRLRRWRKVRAEVEAKQKRRLDPVDDLDLVCKMASTVMAREGRAAVIPRDISWSGRFLWYHLPVLIPLRFFGPIPNPLMGFRSRVALTMVLAAIAYGGVCYWAAKHLA